MIINPYILHSRSYSLIEFFYDWIDPTIPDGWVKDGIHDTLNYVEENINGLRLVGTSTYSAINKNNVFVVGKSYKVETDVYSIASGSVAIDGGFTLGTISTTGVTIQTITPTSTTILLKRISSITDLVIRSIRVYEI